MSENLDRYSEAYSNDRNPYNYDSGIIHNWYAKRILELAGNASCVLDLGIGRGSLAHILSGNFSRYAVVEGSKKVIDNYRINYPDCPVEIIHSSFEDFNTSERFDFINMGFVLEHVGDPFQILTRYKNFLEDNGSVLVTVPNAESLNRRLGHLSGILDDITKLSENDLYLGHRHYFTTRSLKEIVIKAGYNADLVEGIYLKPFTTQQMISLNLSKDIVEALCKIGVLYPELSVALLFQLSKECK